MTQYDLAFSIEALIPYFFPEIKSKKTTDCVFIEFRKNRLMFSITFYMESFNCSNFEGKLKKLNSFLKMDGISSLDDLIRHETDEEKDSITYYYKIPLNLAQGFSD